MKLMKNVVNNVFSFQDYYIVFCEENVQKFNFIYERKEVRHKYEETMHNPMWKKENLG